MLCQILVLFEFPNSLRKFDMPKVPLINDNLLLASDRQIERNIIKIFLEFYL